MRNKLLVLFFWVLSFVGFGQQEITWKDLSNVKFTNKYFKEYDDYFMYPTFLAVVKTLEGKRVTLKGYFLDIIQEENVFILSKGPMASCYFCGLAGPETALEIQYINSNTFKTDDVVAITGTLQLNQNDVNHLNYILRDCTGKKIK